MKKIVMTSFLMLTFISGFSQEKKSSEKKKIQFGIMGGLNQDFLAASPYEFNGLNFYVGFFAEQRLSDKLGLQLEMLYKSTQGSGYNTVQFPLLLKYNLTEKFRVYSGVQLNWSFRDPYADRIYDEKPGNFTLNVGVEYDMSAKWYLTGRYVHGFKKFPSNSGGDAREGTFLLGVGYRF